MTPKSRFKYLLVLGVEKPKYAIKFITSSSNLNTCSLGTHVSNRIPHSHTLHPIFLDMRRHIYEQSSE